MRTESAFAIACAFLLATACSEAGNDPARLTAEQASHPNVVMIVLDDLNDWVGYLGGNPQTRTPHIDRLAASGAAFERAYAQSAICNPSRASTLFGIQPTTSGLYEIEPLPFETMAAAGVPSIATYFADHGYLTMASGKIHHGHEYPDFADSTRQTTGPGPFPARKLNISFPGVNQADYGAFPADENDLHDTQVAEWAIEGLARDYDQPFFLALGFYRPHLPLYAPQEYFDLHPIEKVELPARIDGHPDYLSAFASREYLNYMSGWPASVRRDGKQRELVQAYLASISYVDAMVGRVLTALEQSAHAENTIVVLWSDHGFHLGSHGRYGKRSMWEEAARVPLIIAGPSVQPTAIRQPVGLIDLYPTLVALAGLPTNPRNEGRNLSAVMSDPDIEWPYAALTSHLPGEHAVRTSRWTYMRHADGSEELFDYTTDPAEAYDLAETPRGQIQIEQLRKHLPATAAGLVTGRSSRRARWITEQYRSVGLDPTQPLRLR